MSDLRLRTFKLSDEINIALVKDNAEKQVSQIEKAKEMAQQKYLLEQKAHDLRVEQLLSRIDEFISYFICDNKAFCGNTTLSAV